MKHTDRTNTPDGYYNSIKDWIVASNLRKKKYMKNVLFDDPVFLTEPTGLENPTFWTVRFSESTAPFKQRNGRIDIITKGRVYGAKPDILTPDHKLIWEHSREKNIMPDQHSIFQQNRLPPVKKTTKTLALLSIKDSRIYYHWMLDVLPRLHIMKQCGIQADAYIINGRRMAPFQYETLEALGIPKEKVIVSHSGLHLQAKKLIIPHFSRGIRPKWVCDFLRQELMINKKIEPVKGFERIFISRANAGKRKLLNEEEVMGLLAKYGFQSIRLEEKSVAEQIQIFASAKVVVAPHGAGLTNVLFSDPGTKVIEFLAPSLVHNCYPILSSLLGHRHYYIIGEGERPPEYVDPHDRKANITVRLSDVREILKMAGIQ
ncbi:glycosyltransferase family 61 protein [Paenibacillus sp. GCM10027628]|uniref:glycosyltransferase family 61 protein n=1 Tax=Paenibacillus sp. GCM10027628 TaxID=3273413 RepID=UPI0036256F6D